MTNTFMLRSLQIFLYLLRVLLKPLTSGWYLLILLPKRQWLAISTFNHEADYISMADGHRYHAPAHIKEYIDNITPGTNADFEKWKFGLASGIVNGGFPSPLLKEAWMTIQALVAIPELAICDSAITLVCKQTVHNVTEIFAPDFARS
ncbi:uncharacterized protein L3040_004750 [Drepanopeziza brunnea f. sp. 'multigermtubi']|uniref:uncharacterized protein n=1 Tax=Drepanopeziza brunnea f. sp. 'multigermtubi' TaxID=698441 RepID=UPI0023987C1F|nr:hypothetical protein L3040_004750 [Drepanopeziza brunnea f. sp. 'multigermtubi']